MTSSPKKEKPTLLHEVSFAKRVEFYEGTMREALSQGKSVIILTPEIRDIYRLEECLHFSRDETIGILHSGLSPREQFEEWERIRAGKARVVLGTRSAIFAPLKRLGLIIIEREEDRSFKSERSPRYHSRTAALIRAELEGCRLLLGSATPSLESYFWAKKGKFRLICPKKKTPPEASPVEIVDMRRERRRIISLPLEERIKETLSRNEKIILFFNRRGFFRELRCRVCGESFLCPRCQIALGYHHRAAALLCHYCNYRIAIPDRCPGCGSRAFRYRGKGCELVEAEVRRLFPRARTVRLDAGTVKTRKNYEALIKEFQEGETEILIGTRIISHEGFDVGLVGIISADTLLNLPDFRAGERTFALLFHLIQQGKRTLIQSFIPNHYPMKALTGGGYEDFYRHEITSRRELGLPPFRYLVRIVLSGEEEKKVAAASGDLARTLREKKIIFSGPAPAPRVKLRGKYRSTIFLKGKKLEEILLKLDSALKRFKRPSRLNLMVDVDPEELM